MASQNETLKESYKEVFNNRIGFGSRFGVLVIDLIKAYVAEDSPLYAKDVEISIDPVNRLLNSARAHKVPIFFSKVGYNKNLRDGGLFVKKVPILKTLTEGAPMGEITNDLKVTREDTVFYKQYASAFFGTSLSSTLSVLGIDTLILAGCSTSGCVRATAVDGMQHGFRVIVPRECVADRHIEPHMANLFDIDAKYGDVVSLSEVIERIEIAKESTF